MILTTMILTCSLHYLLLMDTHQENLIQEAWVHGEINAMDAGKGDMAITYDGIAV